MTDTDHPHHPEETGMVADYGDPPAPIEASTSALSCADEAVWDEG
jgi:hypothetical protein